MMTTYTRKPFYRRGIGASASSFWRGVVVGSTSGSGGSPDSSVPVTAIMTEDGGPIFTESSGFLLVES